MTKPTNQKARECAEAICATTGDLYHHESIIEEIILRHFADEPEQPDKSLDEIVEKHLPLQKYYEQTREQAKQACIEYVAQLQQVDDGWRYFRTHGIEKLPIDTEINCHGAWHLAATYPAYDAATNYQARTKGAI
jgi:hypothetical protein